MQKVVSTPGLEPYLLALETQGLTVVPPEVHGFAMADFDAMVEVLLEQARQMTGSEFSLAEGPKEALVFPRPPENLSRDTPEPGQFLIQQLSQKHRLFRNLAVNPVALELIRSQIGQRATRFSSHNSFIKWQGDYGYGPSLGMHADQTAQPLPWGRNALTANTNWCLTDYTLENGCLAYVPGSHRFGTPAQFPKAVQDAVPVIAPKGSMIVFHGATWHGAFPKQTHGLRLSVANYYRHMMVLPQEDLVGGFPRALAADCDDPESFEQLCGFEDTFPYRRQSEVVPVVAAKIR